MNKTIFGGIEKICIVLVLLTVSTSLFVFAESKQDGELNLKKVNKAFDVAYPDMKFTLPPSTSKKIKGKIQDFNGALTNQYKIAIYGNPHGEEKTVKGHKEPVSRYLGYTYNGIAIPNPDFPHDSTTDIALSDLKWKEAPENAPDYAHGEKTGFAKEYEQYKIAKKIIKALDGFAKEGKRGNISDSTMTDEEKAKMLEYVNIIYPPTAYTHGLVTIHHDSFGTDYYIDVLLDIAEEAPEIDLDPPKPKALNSNEYVLKGKKLSLDLSKITGKIHLNSQQFDVSTAIPTGENLDINATVSSPYLFDYSMDKVFGTKEYYVTVNKPYSLVTTAANGQTETTDNTYTVTYIVSRDYSYYRLNALYYYSLKELIVFNHKLNVIGQVVLTLADSDYQMPSLIYSNYKEFIKLAPLADNVSYDEKSQTFTVSLEKQKYSDPKEIVTWDLSAFAESAVPELLVRNDKVRFAGEILSSDDWLTTSTGEPKTAELATTANLVLKNYLLSHKITNGSDKTSGELNYDLTTGYDFNQELKGIAIDGNDLIIHTPVVNQCHLEQAVAFDQRVGDKQALDALPLDKTLSFDFKTKGEHISAKGYGDREYKKYVKAKILRLDCPAFVAYDRQIVDKGDISAYLPVGEDFIVDVDKEKLYLKIPHWVKEGNHSLKTFVIAKNSKALSAEERANLNLQHDVASYAKSVEVTGRLFDFQIVDSPARMWQPLFDKVGKIPVIFTAGDLNKNGEASKKSAYYGGDSPYKLPLKTGKNNLAGYEDVSFKLGYPVEFVIKSMGDFYHENDGVVIDVDFNYIAPDGSKQAVDLYYQNNKGEYVRIGSDNDTELIKYITAGSRFNTRDMILSTNMALSMLEKSTADQFLSEVYQNNSLGFYHLLGLSNGQRNLIGKVNNLPQGVDKFEAQAGVQLWYGKYYLPATTIAIPVGTDLNQIYDKASDLILKDGELAVKFRPLLYRSDKKHVRLAYQTEYSNEWQVEGYNNSVDEYGTVLYYKLDQKLSDDIKIH